MKETETITFRISKPIVDKMREVAKENKMSANVLVNRILESYVDWDLHSLDAGWIPMQKQVLTELIKEVGHDEILQASKVLGSIFKDISLLMRGEYDLNQWISIVRSRAAKSGFKVSEFGENGNINMVIQHDMGEKWSMLFKLAYENVLHDLGVNASFDYTDKTIVMKLENAIHNTLWHK